MPPRDRARPTPVVLSIVVLSVLGAWPGAPALAVDGALEINQACAASSGCFPGDATGLPVVITAPGSYRLTSDLTVPDANTDAIWVQVHPVTLDLNGFAILGITVCDGTPLVCAPLGTGTGIVAFAPGGALSVRHGTLQGMGRDGLRANSSQVRVAAVTATSNGRDGIACGSSGCRVHDSSMHHNGRDGAFVGRGGEVYASTSFANGGDGVELVGDNHVRGNTVWSNEGDGIRGSVSSNFEGNTVSENGGDGIEAGDGSLLRGNVARTNGGSGLNCLSARGGATGNVLLLNAGGDLTGCSDLGHNLCNLGACP